MRKLQEVLDGWSPYMLSVLRIVAAFMFFQHGAQKLFGFPPSPYPPPELLSMGGIGGILEFFGGLLLLIGLFTRPVAFILSGEMAVAFFMAHFKFDWPAGILPILNHGELAVLYCFVFLYFAVAGGGKISLDYLLFRTRSTHVSQETISAV